MGRRLPIPQIDDFIQNVAGISQIMASKSVRELQLNLS